MNIKQGLTLGAVAATLTFGSLQAIAHGSEPGHDYPPLYYETNYDGSYDLGCESAYYTVAVGIALDGTIPIVGVSEQIPGECNPDGSIQPESTWVTGNIVARAHTICTDLVAQTPNPHRSLIQVNTGI